MGTDCGSFVVNMYFWMSRQSLHLSRRIKRNAVAAYALQTVSVIYSRLYTMFRASIYPDYIYNPTLGSGAELYFLPGSDFRAVGELGEKWPIGWETIVCINYSGLADFRKKWTAFSYENVIEAEETEDTITYLYTTTHSPSPSNSWGSLWKAYLKVGGVHYLQHQLITLDKKAAKHLHVKTMPRLVDDTAKKYKGTEYWCRVRRSLEAVGPRGISSPISPILSSWRKATVFVEYCHPDLRDPITFPNFRQFLHPGNEILDKQFVEWILRTMDKGHLYDNDYKINVLSTSPSNPDFQEFEVVCGQHIAVGETALKLAKD